MTEYHDFSFAKYIRNGRLGYRVEFDELLQIMLETFVKRHGSAPAAVIVHQDWEGEAKHAVASLLTWLSKRYTVKLNENAIPVYTGNKNGLRYTVRFQIVGDAE